MRYRAIDASHQGAGGRYTRRTVERGFGGLWIADKQEFAKFASATVNNRFEKDWEGVCYTDNHFYAYYRNIDGEPVPFIEVNLNAEGSQGIIQPIYEQYVNGATIEGSIRGHLEAYRGADDVSNDNNGRVGEAGPQSQEAARRMDSSTIRRGKYADNPGNYVKDVESVRPHYHRDGGIDTTAASAREGMAERAVAAGRGLGVSCPH